LLAKSTSNPGAFLFLPRQKRKLSAPDDGIAANLTEIPIKAAQQKILIR
jgi:hypothetical protein